MSSQQALQIARQRDLDLIEVAPGAQPPVCRIMDFGKHKYEMQKKEREAHKKTHASEVRLIRLKPQIDAHDLGIKVKKLREMLAEGDKVRIQLRFRGREMSRPHMGTELLQRSGRASGGRGDDRRVSAPGRAHDEYAAGAQAEYAAGGAQGKERKAGQAGREAGKAGGAGSAEGGSCSDGGNAERGGPPGSGGATSAGAGEGRLWHRDPSRRHRRRRRSGLSAPAPARFCLEPRGRFGPPGDGARPRNTSGDWRMPASFRLRT